MKPIEHVLLYPIIVLLTWCVHANIVLKSYLYIIERIEIADEFSTSKTQI